ncbi:hypothetical protein PoB_003487300 [Plakobranchus ocellatus]|uniref:Secreted protein n=1 Tax=Plakobranchus ocellatus TaxID=259542 RepID=A0AAV4AP83_9GAST|nr:hypothetical protein PoB_003487300 [Plakobranchus ocellatus]
MARRRITCIMFAAAFMVALPAARGYCSGTKQPIPRGEHWLIPGARTKHAKPFLLVSRLHEERVPRSCTKKFAPYRSCADLVNHHLP